MINGPGVQGPKIHGIFRSHDLKSFNWGPNIQGPKIHGILGPRILSPLTEDLISSGPKVLGLKLLWTLGPRITGPWDLG